MPQIAFVKKIVTGCLHLAAGTQKIKGKKFLLYQIVLMKASKNIHIIDSYHRTVRVGRNLKDQLVPTLYHRHGHHGGVQGWKCSIIHIIDHSPGLVLTPEGTEHSGPSSMGMWCWRQTYLPLAGHISLNINPNTFTHRPRHSGLLTEDNYNI